MPEHYYGILFAIFASILWSITVTIVKPITNNISPFLINPIKNSIGFILFILLFLIIDVPLWYDTLYTYEYAIILLSGSLGMVLGDTIFIYALSQIGANRVAIVDSFSPLTYEKDYEDIDYRVKRFGILLVLGAMACTGFGVVYLKTVLNRINEDGVDIHLNLWITAFRLVPGVVLSWIIFLLKKNKYDLIQPLKIKHNLRILCIASFLGPFLALGFWILGYTFIAKPSVTSIIGQTSVVFIVILSWLFLKEKITKLRILSTTLVFIGVILATFSM